MPRITLLFITVLVQLNVWSQSEQLEAANEYFSKRFYKEAAIGYTAALKEELDAESRVLAEDQLAMSYFKLFDYEQGEQMYRQIVNRPSANPEHWMNFGLLLMNNGKYSEAKSAFEQYNLRIGTTEPANVFIESCNWSRTHLDSIKEFTVHPTDIETGGRSLGIAYYEGQFLYSTPQSSQFDSTTVFYDLTRAKCSDDTVFRTPLKLGGMLNRSFYEGTPSLTSDFKTLYFSGNASERTIYKEKKRVKKNYEISSEGINILKIYSVERTDTIWGNKQELPFCSNEYSCTHPSISPDGKRLYFVSDMPGGLGGFDLYVSEKTASGWSEPKNLGAEVNTAFNEMTPFFQNDSLYFSSKGLVGFGGADIFAAIVVDKEVKRVTNLGQPFNSSKDDFSFIKNSAENEGYFSSNRAGSNGYDHIYFFKEIVKPVIIYPDTIIGIAINRVTGDPISGVKVALTPIVDEASSNVVETDEGGEVTLILPKNQRFVATFTAEGYEPKVIEIPAEDRENVIAKFGELEFLPIAEKEKIITIDNIYFDFDKATIRDESLEALEKIMEYLNYHKDIKVELSAHTDSRGSDSYNMNLSKRRAESTVKWLVEHGINKDRLVPAGYGETQLVNQCKNGVECSDEEHLKNRRVQLKVL